MLLHLLLTLSMAAIASAHAAGGFTLHIDSDGHTRVHDETPADVVHASPAGAVYTRWGRTTCRDGAEVLYTGVVAAGCNNPQEFICLSNTVSWNRHHNATIVGQGTDLGAGLVEPALWHQYGNTMCGAEYSENLFPDVNPFDDVPCAVCQVASPVQVMIPGTDTRPEGWHEEYHGFLMLSNDQMGTSYLCVDADAEPALGGSAANSPSVQLIHAVANCESPVPCPHYDMNLPVACVVCSKNSEGLIGGGTP